MLYPLFSSARNRSLKRIFDVDKFVYEAMKTQKELEDRHESSIDIAADPTARMIAEILKVGYMKLSKKTDEKVERLMEWIGYNLGKWIYTLDAYDDIKIDIEKKHYNPFIEMSKICDKENVVKKHEEIDVEEFERIKETFRANTEFILESCLSQIGKSLELMNESNKGILENIVYLGMQKKMKEILYKTCNDKCNN